MTMTMVTTAATRTVTQVEVVRPLAPLALGPAQEVQGPARGVQTRVEVLAQAVTFAAHHWHAGCTSRELVTKALGVLCTVVD
jgi:hypothetical protein